MTQTLGQLAQLVGGALDGDADLVISGVAPFDRAGAEEITFAGSREFLKRVPSSQAGCVLVPTKWDGEARSVIRVPNPQLAFAMIVNALDPEPRCDTGIHPSAVIGENVTLADGVCIGPNAVIGHHVSLGDGVGIGPGTVVGNDVVIDAGTILHPNVTIGAGCQIGCRVTIHPGTVIGSDGFGYVPEGSAYYKLPHRGAVQIDDDVEIGANVTIDRAMFGMTHIGRGVKIDNLVHVAHNCVVGEDTLLIAQVGVSGSVTIGRHVILAGQVGVAGHLTIGDNVMIGAQSGIGKSIEDGKMLSGSPVFDHRKWLRVQKMLPQLPELKKTIRRLQQRLDALEAGESGVTDQKSE